MPLKNRSIQEVNGRVIHEWSMQVPMSRLWWGLTDPEALPRWLGTLTDGNFVNGGVVTIQHAKDYSCTSQILAYEPEQLLEMTWNFPDENLSYLQIRTIPTGDAIDLVLTHDALGDEAANYLTGWHTHLLYLEGLLLGRPRSMDQFWSTYELLSEI